MWWWQFDKSGEPLQEDLVTYEKFLDIKADRERMNRDKAAQKAGSKKGGISSIRYNIRDPE